MTATPKLSLPVIVLSQTSLVSVATSRTPAPGGRMPTVVPGSPKLTVLLLTMVLPVSYTHLTLPTKLEV
ncbi:MAG: hypothetical protein KUG77_03085 [Nannocystaceae bacterium]|nr:hypothetical protein [Nannocystaceae bacterium]